MLIDAFVRSSYINHLNFSFPIEYENAEISTNPACNSRFYFAKIQIYNIELLSDESITTNAQRKREKGI